MKAQQPRANKNITRIKADDTTSFIGLNAYSEAQADFFFGRNDEIAALADLVKINSLTLLFGKSGTGKTSLLNAGVFPRLRKEFCMPFRIRLTFLKDSADMITQIKQVLKAQIDEYGFNVESYPGEETLWEYFHREPLWKLITPILVFDQFEEIFTLAQKNSQFKKEDFEAFVEEISSVIENEVPRKVKAEFLSNNEHISFLHHQQKAKIIFSFREDFLPEFESFSAKIPSVKNARFRLMPMNGSQAFEVITKTWGSAIDENEAAKIVLFLTNHPKEQGAASSKIETADFDNMAIEPSLLSQVCSFIDKNRKKEGLKKISSAFLRKYPKDVILRSLYTEVLLEGEQAMAGRGDKPIMPDDELKAFIEDNLVTDEGFRSRYITDKINAGLAPGITLLTRKYFLREEGETIELTHDVIVALVTADRDKRRKALAVAEADRRARRRVAIISLLALFCAFALWWYITHKASARNDELLAENQKLELAIQKKVDSLGKSDSVLRSYENRTNNTRTDPSAPPKTMNGLNADSIRLTLEKGHDSLLNINKTIKQKEVELLKEKERLKADLTTLINEKKELGINLAKLSFQNERLLALPRLSDSLKLIEHDNDKIKKQLDAYKKTGLEYLFRIDSLRTRISILENKLSRYDRLFEQKPNSKSKEKIFGYGYDYAEDKVKKP